VREKIVEAALWAVLVGAAAGLVVAALITLRLRRIAAAAAAIERGSFESPLRPRFPDELGSLAATIDRMRERLRDSFSRLESERDRLGRLLGRLQEGVVTFDRTLRIEFVNPSASRLLGVAPLSEGDPLPDPWPDVSLRRLAVGLFAERAPVAHARVSPGEDCTLAVVGLPARTASESAVIVVTDVSERERRERAEREFVTNAAHELRTPIAAITGAVEVLQAGAKDDPEARDRFIAHIERESARLGRLTKALLTLARAQTQEEAPRLVPVPLEPLLEEVASAVTPADGVRVEVRCDATLAALAERDVIEQALANVVANAARHTREGSIVLRARPHGQSSVAIEVIDTGPGIEPRERERIFDRFYRGGERTADGFGLGLAIVQQAVRVLGGVVEVESTPGRGTTIRVVLEAATQRAA
jgi:signal transduction histidine kinase/HAMP domain-containing protein